MAEVRVAVVPPRPWQAWIERLRAWHIPQGLSASQLRSFWRRRLFAVLGGMIAVVAIASVSWWYVVSLGSVSTDDAYVDASVADITPLINGPVRDVAVHDTQNVKRGDVLVVIDPSDEQIAVAQAEANYSQALRHVRQDFANAAAAAAQVDAREADLRRAQLDDRRRVALASTGAVSGDELTTAKNALETAKANLDGAKGQLAAQLALIQGKTVENNPEVLAAKAALDAARLALSRTVIRAPVDGIVAQNQVQIGQRVEVGTTLMTIVPVSQVYVDANFKEGQLTKVRIGQPVTLTSDLYGSDVAFHGHVAGVGGGTGAAFAVIPAQNATGNWIKVVQRLPVRVALDPQELAHHPLRVGLSMTARIDVSR
ncbi:MAG: HlyD family efflux transporter periplasmic adaptor subunit [Rhizomicrobium sp.]